MEALFLLVAEIAVRAQHYLQMTRQILFTEESCNGSGAGPLVARNLQKLGVRSGDLRHQRVAQEAHYFAREVDGAMALGHEPIHELQHFPTVALGDCPHHLLNGSRRSRANELPHGLRSE